MLRCVKQRKMTGYKKRFISAPIASAILKVVPDTYLRNHKQIMLAKTFSSRTSYINDTTLDITHLMRYCNIPCTGSKQLVNLSEYNEVFISNLLISLTWNSLRKTFTGHNSIKNSSTYVKIHNISVELNGIESSLADDFIMNTTHLKDDKRIDISMLKLNYPIQYPAEISQDEYATIMKLMISHSY
jgi:hypothetical protein